MSYSFFSHTGDIGVALRSASLDSLFADAAIAFTDAVSDHRLVAVTRLATVELHSTAIDLLLIDWLNELVFRLDTNLLLVARVDVAVTGTLGDWTVRATLHGETLDAARHRVRTLVKAATYHALEVSRQGDEWYATVVLDV